MSFSCRRNCNALSSFLLFFPFLIWAETSVGLIGVYRNFQEDLPSFMKSEEKGFLYGIDAKYELEVLGLWIQISERYLRGKTEYIGTLLDLETSEITLFSSHTLNDLSTAEANLGVYIFNTIPFLGLGYHKWFREAVDRKTGYDEFYQWIYLSFGLNVFWNLCKEIKLGIVLKAMRTMRASVEITECFEAPLSLSLADRWQAEVQLPLQILFSEQFKGSVEGFYRHERLGASEESEIEGVWMREPCSMSQNLGFLMRLFCSF